MVESYSGGQWGDGTVWSVAEWVWGYYLGVERASCGALLGEV